MLTLIGILSLALSVVSFKVAMKSDPFEFGFVFMLGAILLFIGGVIALVYGVLPVIQQLH